MRDTLRNAFKCGTDAWNTGLSRKFDTLWLGDVRTISRYVYSTIGWTVYLPLWHRDRSVLKSPKKCDVLYGSLFMKMVGLKCKFHLIDVYCPNHRRIVLFLHIKYSSWALAWMFVLCEANFIERFLPKYHSGHSYFG